MRLVPALVLLAWGLLLAAWVMGNAPFAAPDEADHYIRAIGVSEGRLLGKADPSARIGVTLTQVAWTAQATRLVSLPRGLDPDPFTCELRPGELSAACLNAVDPRPPPVTAVTTVGNYQPLPYLLPAVLVRAASSAPAALRLGRAAEALSAFALLAIAVFALYDAVSPLLSLLDLLLAVTPMALFCGATLSGSSTEIAGGVAFFSCLLRVCRTGPLRARWWAFTALSGAVLADDPQPRAGSGSGTSTRRLTKRPPFRGDTYASSFVQPSWRRSPNEALPESNPPLGVTLMDLAEDVRHLARDVPVGIVALERLEVADPPTVIAHPVVRVEAPGELATGDLLTQLDRLERRAVAGAPPADVIDRARAWRTVKGRERGHQVGGVDVVAHLLTAIAIHGVGLTGHRAAHQIGEKGMQTRARMVGARPPSRNAPLPRSAPVAKGGGAWDANGRRGVLCVKR
jgi:hypothetical protein